MARVTYREPDGSWGIPGLDWKELVALPSPVYGALCKLKHLEDLIDLANTEDLRTDTDVMALETLLTMGGKARRDLSWILQRLP